MTTTIEIGPVTISVRRLIESVWDAVQADCLTGYELSQRDAEMLREAAQIVTDKVRSYQVDLGEN